MFSGGWEVRAIVLFLNHPLGSMDASGSWGPLHYRVVEGRLTEEDILKYLDVLQQPTDMGTSLLHFAALSNDMVALRLLITHKAKVNVTNRFGETPLHWAGRYGSLEAVTYLLSMGAQPHPKDGDGDTPLHWAAEYGHKPVVKLLLTTPDVDLASENALGQTAYDVAVENESKKMSRYLKKRMKRLKSIKTKSKRSSLGKNVSLVFSL